jgi:hypothetical protein
MLSYGFKVQWLFANISKTTCCWIIETGVRITPVSIINYLTSIIFLEAEKLPDWIV